MAEDKKMGSGGLASAFPVSVVLAMLASLVFTFHLPYQDERPSNRPIQAKYQAAQDVDARLWQDPFAAVEGANDETLNPSHGPSQIKYGNNLVVGDNITVIAVTLPGGPYQEAAEHRMRRRYAVLSGLANQDYTPNDEQHIGYFHPIGEKVLQKKVAFEWWSANSGDKKVLLLWVDESSLLGIPAEKLKTLLGQISQEIPVFQYAVIGPNTSTLLRDMLRELGAIKNNVTQSADAQCVNATLPMQSLNTPPPSWGKLMASP
ncbi:MAG: hypothetical protein NTV43_02875 [Methylococcales bacterium]|nr:hypothetical protein [Methylococcales bacterium]